MKEESFLLKICDFVIKYSIFAAVLLMPILFLPWTTNMIDFNKQTFLILFVFLGLFGFIAKVLLTGKLKLSFDKTHIGALILFLVFALATIFSKDRYGSFWGWPGVASDSLLTIIALVVFYFLVTSAFSKKDIIASSIVFISSSLLAVVIGILHSVGLFVVPFGFAKSASFTTMGLPGMLGFFTASLLPLLFIFLIQVKKWMRVFFSIAIALSAILLVVINYPVVWWMVLISSAIFVIFATIRRNVFDLRWVGLPVFFLIVSLFFIVFQPQFVVSQRAIEVRLNQQASFDIASQTIKGMPIFGSGPGTFAYDFSKYKNINFNQGSLWNLRFDSAGSKILNVLATTGILGLLSFLAFVSAVIFYGVKFIVLSGAENEKKGDVFMIASGFFICFLAETIGFFLYGSGIALDFMYFFLIASFVGLIGERKKEYQLTPSSILTLGVTFASTLFLIFGLGLLILDGQRYIAEINYFKGLNQFSSGQADQGLNYLEKAVSMNPKSDLYLTDLSQAYISKLGAEINRTDLSDDQKTKNVQLLVNNSVNASKIATDINPNSVADWSIRGFVYQNLFSIKVSGTDEWAIKSYEQAMSLEPNNPYYPTQKGLVYMAKASIIDKDNQDAKNNDLKLAKEQFDNAIQLKSDYAPARYQIAMVYQAQGNTDQEISALEDLKKLNPNDVGVAFQIGLTYYQEQNFSSAKAELERAIALSPDYANALYFLGLTYSQLGNDDKAIEKFQKISDLNPNNEEVKKIIDNLKNGQKPLAGISQENPPQAPVQETPPENPKTPASPAKK